MKQKLLLILVLAFALTACGAASGNSPEPAPTIALADNAQAESAASAPLFDSGSVAASGVVVPAEDAQLAFTTAGRIQTVNVKLGDAVKVGDVLAELDNASIQLDINQAERTLRELTSPSAIAAAAQAVANAQKTLEDAENDVARLDRPRVSDTLIEKKQAEIDLAREQLARAEDNYKSVARLADGDPKKAAAQVTLTNARLYLNNLISEYNWYTGSPTETDAALTRADYDTAQVTYQEAVWYLAALQGETLPTEATGSLLARLAQAQDALKAAQLRLDNTQLVAPMGGTVTAINLVAGEFASPGQVVFIITDIAHLQVKTTDLSERDVPKVSEGQQVAVFVEALNETVDGTLVRIAPLSTTLGGDVVYETTIELDTIPEGLRAGMSTEVRFTK